MSRTFCPTRDGTISYLSSTRSISTSATKGSSSAFGLGYSSFFSPSLGRTRVRAIPSSSSSSKLIGKDASTSSGKTSSTTSSSLKPTVIEQPSSSSLSSSNATSFATSAANAKSATFATASMVTAMSVVSPASCKSNAKRIRLPRRKARAPEKILEGATSRTEVDPRAVGSKAELTTSSLLTMPTSTPLPPLPTTAVSTVTVTTAPEKEKKRRDSIIDLVKDVGVYYLWVYGSEAGSDLETKGRENVHERHGGAIGSRPGSYFRSRSKTRVKTSGHSSSAHARRSGESREGRSRHGYGHTNAHTNTKGYKYGGRGEDCDTEPLLADTHAEFTGVNRAVQSRRANHHQHHSGPGTGVEVGVGIGAVTSTDRRTRTSPGSNLISTNAMVSSTTSSTFGATPSTSGVGTVGVSVSVSVSGSVPSASRSKSGLVSTLASMETPVDAKDRTGSATWLVDKEKAFGRRVEEAEVEVKPPVVGSATAMPCLSLSLPLSSRKSGIGAFLEDDYCYDDGIPPVPPLHFTYKRDKAGRSLTGASASTVTLSKPYIRTSVPSPTTERPDCVNLDYDYKAIPQSIPPPPPIPQSSLQSISIAPLNPRAASTRRRRRVITAAAQQIIQYGAGSKAKGSGGGRSRDKSLPRIPSLSSLSGSVSGRGDVATGGSNGGGGGGGLLSRNSSRKSRRKSRAESVRSTRSARSAKERGRRKEREREREREREKEKEAPPVPALKECTMDWVRWAVGAGLKMDAEMERPRPALKMKLNLGPQSKSSVGIGGPVANSSSSAKPAPMGILKTSKQAREREQKQTSTKGRTVPTVSASASNSSLVTGAVPDFLLQSRDPSPGGTGIGLTVAKQASASNTSLTTPAVPDFLLQSREVPTTTLGVGNVNMGGSVPPTPILSAPSTPTSSNSHFHFFPRKRRGVESSNTTPGANSNGNTPLTSAPPSCFSNSIARLVGLKNGSVRMKTRRRSSSAGDVDVEAVMATAVSIGGGGCDSGLVQGSVAVNPALIGRAIGHSSSSSLLSVTPSVGVTTTPSPGTTPVTSPEDSRPGTGTSTNTNAGASSRPTSSSRIQFVFPRTSSSSVTSTLTRKGSQVLFPTRTRQTSNNGSSTPDLSTSASASVSQHQHQNNSSTSLDRFLVMPRRRASSAGPVVHTININAGSSGTRTKVADVQDLTSDVLMQLRKLKAH